MNVFLSYAKEDEQAVHAIRSALSTAGIGYWTPEKDIHPGDSIVSRIEEGIESADRVLIVLSPQSSKSEWVNREIALALAQSFEAHGKRIIPVLLDKKTEIPFFLKDMQYVDLTNPATRCEQLRLLVEAIKEPGSEEGLIQQRLYRRKALALEEKVFMEVQVEDLEKRTKLHVQLVSGVASTLLVLLATMVVGVMAVTLIPSKYVSAVRGDVLVLFVAVAIGTMASTLTAILLPAIRNRLLRRAGLHQTNEG